MRGIFVERFDDSFAVHTSRRDELRRESEFGDPRIRFVLLKLHRILNSFVDNSPILA